ncbi:competence protein ComK [Bacillaceae bacterium S4-13-58]
MTKWITDYEVTPYTYAVLPFNTADVTGSLVVEKGKYLFIDKKPKVLMERACKFFGSSIQGRVQGTRQISGMTHKVPIAVDPHSGMFFFPTNSPTNPKCAWIAHSHISKIITISEKESELLFVTGEKVHVFISPGSLRNQVHRTAHFRYLFIERLQTYYRRSVDHERVAEPSASNELMFSPLLSEWLD